MILDNLSFDIHSGQMIAVVGPNGAGKTSLLRCLLGLNEGFSGNIQVQGQDLIRYSRKALAQKVAYVPQQTDSLFDLNVFDVVQMGLLPHFGLFQLDSQHEQQKVQNALEKVGLQQAKEQKINTLSGGELQRVLIARALVQQADILILDEPTNHLDVYFQHQILSLLRELGITVILTIHDLNLAAQYCDQVILMHQGKVQGVGTPAEVFQEQRLSEVFGLPCSVDLIGKGRNIPSICFHPITEQGVAS